MNKQKALMSSSKRAHSPTEALFVVNVLQESREQHFGDVPILSAHERWKTWRCGWRVSTTVTHSLSILASTTSFLIENKTFEPDRFLGGRVYVWCVYLSMCVRICVWVCVDVFRHVEARVKVVCLR